MGDGDGELQDSPNLQVFYDAAQLGQWGQIWDWEHPKTYQCKPFLEFDKQSIHTITIFPSASVES
jgi:hypothetical protein